MARVARVVPVDVLTEGLGLPDGLAGDVAAVARAGRRAPTVDVPSYADVERLRG
ncbi:MAG: hypothetical protein ACRDQB_11005 [Thermocrispum sp.]